MVSSPTAPPFHLGHIGSCTGGALTIAIVTSTGSGLAHRADIAMAVSAGLAALAVLVLRERA